MEVVVMILHLLNGELAKIPVSLALNQSCNDKFLEIVQVDSKGTSVYYKGTLVRAVHCRKGTGEFVN